jgi:hypothetical protein
MKRQKQSLLHSVLAVVLSICGLVAVISIVRHLAPGDQTDVTLVLSLSGQGNRPISGAEIWIVRPRQELLGITGDNGKARFQTSLPKGRIAQLEARGRTFRVSKELHIPNIARHEIRVNLDPQEYQHGLMELETITTDKNKKQAVNSYRAAVNRIEDTTRQANARRLSVIISPQQPPISYAARSYLSKVRATTAAGAARNIHKLRQRGVNQIAIRLLKGQKHHLEFQIRDSNRKLIGALLSPADVLTVTKASSLIQDALSSWPNDWPPNLRIASQRERLWIIRKRPVDQIITYLNGRPLPFRQSNDATLALLPESYHPGVIWDLKATNFTGLLVEKPVDASTSPRPLTWNWPEWTLSLSTRPRLE